VPAWSAQLAVHYHSSMTATRIIRRVNAPRPPVYRALLDPHAFATWMVPTGMTSHVQRGRLAVVTAKLAALVEAALQAAGGRRKAQR
jgi:uncharacterized protein YndB with AHSA1/START domain